MTQHQIEHLLTQHGLRITPNRISIYEAMAQQKNTFSLTDIENALLHLDKSTVFRTMILFEEQSLIHSIEDGTGSKKFCICPNHGDCQVDENHCHFHCEICGKTICLDQVTVPMVHLPEGFRPKHVNYIIKGICDECAQKGKL